MMQQPLTAVAKWKDQLWIGASTYGLMRKAEKTDKLEVVQPYVRPNAIDARGNLLVSCEDRILETADGKTFTTVEIKKYTDLRKGKKLGDFSAHK